MFLLLCQILKVSTYCDSYVRHMYRKQRKGTLIAKNKKSARVGGKKVSVKRISEHKKTRG